MVSPPRSKQLVAALLCGGLWTGPDTEGKMPSLPDLAPTLQPKPRNVEDEAARAVDVRIICDGTALVPGRSATLGVTFEIARGWNLYWRNPGDSGLPISVKFEAPPGITIGEPLWPVPEREVLPGDILDYVYRRRVTLLFPIAASATLSPAAGAVTIKAECKWLVCKEACVPGGRAAELTIPVSSASEPSKDMPLIEAARERLPRNASDQPAPVVRVSWSGRTLEIACTGAERLTFFPYEGEPQPDDALAAGHAASDRLRLSYAGAEPGGTVRGVLEVRRADRSTFHKVESPPIPAKP